jgi:hypothetical protein
MRPRLETPHDEEQVREEQPDLDRDGQVDDDGQAEGPDQDRAVAGGEMAQAGEFMPFAHVKRSAST